MMDIKRVQAFVFAVSLLAAGAFAQTAPIVKNDFEKGTEKWERRGPASISSSKDVAAGGTKSLKVTGRTEFWNGAQLNVTQTLKANQNYTFSVAVRLAKDEQPDDVKLTMQRGDGDFSGIGAAKVTSDAWTTITGSFRPTGRDPYLLVYVESTRPTTSFYLDDFTITASSEAPPQSGVLISNDFEDLTAQNWMVLGDGVELMSSNAGGSQSLKIMSRTQPWHGPALDVSPVIFKGRTYVLSVSVRLVKGQAEDSLTMKIKQTPQKGEPSYIEVAPMTKVRDSGWVTLTGEYKATTTDNNLIVYVESLGATTAFYLDNFKLSVAP